MRRIHLLFILSSILSVAVTHAQINKITHCPTVNQIKIIRVQKPWTHYYIAYNSDKKYFISKEYIEDAQNGPAPPIKFIAPLSTYDIANKKLSCVYFAFTREENSHPTLMNIGDY